MITRIEIDGFKSFHKFAIDLRPFQAFIGPNGTGKSNLFDAIVLLSHLADDSTLYDAFRKGRGEISELFTIRSDGSRERRMSFAVEMLIARTITDNLGVEADVSATRLRYELRIERRLDSGFERLYVEYEDLRSISGDADRWVVQNISKNSRKDWIVRARRAPYISTGIENGQPFVFRHRDRRPGTPDKAALGRTGRSERTVLSLTSDAEYPTAYAARQEMRNWQFLQLDPGVLRLPSAVYSTTVELLPDGSNLAAVLYRMSREDEFALTDVSRDMAELVSGILDISVRTISEREEFIIEATMENGTTLSSRVLSDGTLRLLTLVTLKNDPHYRGVLCLEEPENGVHPFRLKQIVRILRSLATNFDSDNNDAHPQQVLINTHSPSLLPHLDKDALLFVDMRARGEARETAMTPVASELIEDPQVAYYTLKQVERYLNSAPSAQMIEQLKKPQ